MAALVWRLRWVDRHENCNDPKLSNVVFGLMGAARGLDEGLIGTSASQKSFIALFGLKDPSKSATEQADLLSNITSMVQLGSIGGALFAFFITDKIG